MKKDGTYMNSFLFNVTLILLSSCSITQFCADCLEDYVAFTDINMIFNIQIRYLKFFKFFYKYHIFQYILFIIFVISLIYLLIKPSDSVNKVLKNPKLELNNSGNDNNKTDNNNTSSGTSNTLEQLDYK
jgi:LMBR1 domain-containing protein 1